MKEDNKKIKYTKNLSLEELSNRILVNKEEILNNTEFLDFKIDPNKKLSFDKLNKIANIYGYEFYQKKQNNFLLILYILIFFSLLSTATYSMVSYLESKNKNDNEKQKTGTLNVNTIFTEDSNIDLYNTYPISKEKAKELKPLVFTVKNLGTLDSNYKIRLLDYSYEYKNDYKDYEKLDYKYIRYSLECKNDNKLNKEGLLSDLIISNNEMELDSLILLNSQLKVGSEKKEFEFRLWVDSNADSSAANKYFVGKIILESESDK